MKAGLHAVLFAPCADCSLTVAAIWVNDIGRSCGSPGRSKFLMARAAGADIETDFLRPVIGPPRTCSVPGSPVAWIFCGRCRLRADQPLNCASEMLPLRARVRETYRFSSPC